MMNAILLGSGGSRPCRYRGLTSLYLKVDDISILVDCGEGTQLNISNTNRKLRDINMICLTHLHADHVSGLIGLLSSVANDDRTEPLTIVGPVGIERVVKGLKNIVRFSNFKLIPLTLTGETCEIDLGKFIIKAFEVDHSIECYGYSFIEPRAGKFNQDLAERNTVPSEFWLPLQNGEYLNKEGKIIDNTFVYGNPRRGLKLTYSTDTRPCKNLLKNAKDSDVLFCEGMYEDTSKLERALTSKHMLMEEAAVLAKEANVDKLVITHIAPEVSNPEYYLKKLTKIFPNTVMGSDLLTVNLNYRD